MHTLRSATLVKIEATVPSYRHKSRKQGPQREVDLGRIETDDHRGANHENGGGHIPKLLQFFQSEPVLGDVLVFELDVLLRKILFRLAAEHSTRLGINYDSLHTEQQFPEKRAA